MVYFCGVTGIIWFRLFFRVGGRFIGYKIEVSIRDFIVKIDVTRGGGIIRGGRRVLGKCIG